MLAESARGLSNLHRFAECVSDAKDVTRGGSNCHRTAGSFKLRQSVLAIFVILIAFSSNFHGVRDGCGILYEICGRHHGSANRIGGLPTHTPEKIPRGTDEDNYFAFVAEFHVDGLAIALPTIKKIQLYQPIDDGDDPTPLVGVVRRLEDTTGRVLQFQSHPTARRRDILLEQAIDPDVMPDLHANLEVAALFRSKLSGVNPWEEPKSCERFLGQLGDVDSGLNFGGLTCCLFYSQNTDEVFAELK